MGAIGASAFIFRDFLQYILPTVILVCLFVPFFKGTTVDTTLLIFSAFVFGYIIYSPIDLLSNKFQSLLPNDYLSLRDYTKQREWWSKNWNYEKLWFILDKDEREYLYLTQSYHEFYRITGFYLIIYSLLNLGHLTLNLMYTWTPLSNIVDLFSKILAIHTQLLGGLSVPTLYVIIISVILGVFLFKDAVFEYGLLFLEDGFFVNYAKRYHESQGNIATSVWGRVYQLKGPVKESLKNVEVSLFKNGNLLARERTNEDGYFQIIDVFDECIDFTCKTVIMDTNWYGETEMEITAKTVPCFVIKAQDIPVQAEKRDNLN